MGVQDWGDIVQGMFMQAALLAAKCMGNSKQAQGSNSAQLARVVQWIAVLFPA